jgi:hypothetical protein
MAQLLKYSAHDPISSLLDSHLHPGGLLIGAKHRGISLNHTVREAHTRMQFIKNCLAYGSLYARLIDTLEPVSRMHQALRHLPIIGQDHQPCRIVIETPDWEIGRIMLG